MAGLFDYEFQLEKINRHNPPLQKLDSVIKWELFRQALEKAFTVEAKGTGGRPPFDRLMMFKVVILQRYYNLSDEQTEFQIKDRLSFQQFLGLQIGDKVPDEKTIWLFKEHVKEKGLSKQLFEMFTSSLISNGIIAKEGSIVDASFVNVPRQRNSKEENDAIKQGNIPKSLEDNQAKLSQKDCDARWTTKNRERHYGYKNHVNADAKTKLITKFTTSSANVHDSQKAYALKGHTDRRLYADSAYISQDIDNKIWLKGIKSYIHERAYKNRPLTYEQETKNSLKLKVRSRVEHIFGYMTNSMNNGLNPTYNLFRYEQLIRLQKVSKM